MSVTGIEVIRVLLVEDSPSDELLTRAALPSDTTTRFEVSTARTLAEALALGAAASYDVMLLDLSLPDSVGLGTFQEVHLALPHLPVIVLTGQDDERGASATVGAGAQDWIDKRDVHERLLPRAVTWAIRRHRALTDLGGAVAERDAANAELAAANARLATMARERSEFVAVASHELRTPVTVLAGLTDTLVRCGDELDADDRARSLEALHRQSRRLAELVDDLLMMARLDRGRAALRPVQLELGPAITAAVGASLLSQVDVEVVVPAGLDVHADESGLARILRNLLDNAAKYGAAPVRVDARTCGDGTVALRVIDRGAGVPEAFVPLLFEPFTQADESATRTEGGTGLGLSISHGLATAMGGDLGLVRVPGAGAAFEVVLPASAGTPRRATRVLVVDDQPDLRDLAAAFLAADDMVVEQAASAEEALRLFDSFQPDVSVLDYMMPGTNGIETAREIVGRAPDHRVVLWSAFVDDDVRGIARAAGVAAVADKRDLQSLRLHVTGHG